MEELSPTFWLGINKDTSENCNIWCLCIFLSLKCYQTLTNYEVDRTGNSVTYRMKNLWYAKIQIQLMKRKKRLIS